MTHALIELAGSISTTFPKKHGGRPLVPTDIQKITLSIPASNFILVGDPTPNKIHPNNIVDGQFSLYFQVANALIYGSNTGLEAYKKLQDPAIRDLCSKTTVLPDEKVRGFPGRISIVWADGTEEEQYQEFALGEIEHPFTKDRVEAKFFSLAAPAYGQAKAEQILKTVDALESANLASFFKLLQ
jgi:2-methylcitrate dehydratase PrpD